MSEDNPSEPFFKSSRRSYGFESTHKPQSPINKRVILISAGIVILVLLVVIAGFASSNKKGEEVSPVPTEATFPTDIVTPTIEESPTPTSEPTTKTTPSPTPKTTVIPTGSSGSSVDKTTGLDRANLTIAIQNGSGVAGAATKVSNILKDLGYEVVSAGNADNFEYEDTVIQVKSTKKTYLDLLKKDLSSDYTIGEATADLTGSTADAVVIVGKN